MHHTESLLHKLKMYGFHSHLLSWFTSYLTDRKQWVIVEGARDEGGKMFHLALHRVRSWVRCYFSYLLIIICLVSCCKLSLFADDVTCHRKALSYNDYKLLQNDLNSLYDYGQRWGLKFSFEKCTIWYVTRKKNVILNLLLTIYKFARCDVWRFLLFVICYGIPLSIH